MNKIERRRWHGRLMAMAAAIMLLTVGSARAQQDYPEPDAMVECPQAVKAKFPTCAMAMVVTTDEKLATCYCGSNVTPQDSVTIPGAVIKRKAIVTVEKHVPKGGGPDPCQVMVIGGKKQTVCW